LEDIQEHREIFQIAKLNSSCADCGTEGADWVSINLGTFICLQCSGVHRSFGTHISQVRSVRLDKWTSDTVQVGIQKTVFCFFFREFVKIVLLICCTLVYERNG
jgi:recombinational DNA repair protein (RecF pathway)